MRRNRASFSGRPSARPSSGPWSMLYLLVAQWISKFTHGHALKKPLDVTLESQAQTRIVEISTSQVTIHEGLVYPVAAFATTTTTTTKVIVMLDSGLTILADTDSGGMKCPEEVVAAVKNKKPKTLQDLLDSSGSTLCDCTATFNPPMPSVPGMKDPEPEKVTGTALHFAAYVSDKDVVKVLLDKGFDANAGTPKVPKKNAVWPGGCGPIMFAVAANNCEVVELLLQTPDVNVNLANEAGRTALIYAAAFGSNEAVKVLLGQLGVDKGINVNMQDKNGRTALILAAILNRVEVVERLLGDQRTDVNLQDGYGWTALILAVGRNSVEAVERLLGDNRTDVNLLNEFGRTALILAADQNSVEVVVRLLADKRTDVNLPNKDGRTALILAAGRNSVEALRALLGKLGTDKGIDVNIENQEGQTALAAAVAENNTEASEMLCSDNRTDQSKVLMYAAQKNKPEVGSRLRDLETCTDVDANAMATTPKGKRTALMIAAKEGYDKVADAILKFKPDLDLRDKDNETAFFKAAKNCRSEVLAVLKDADVNAKDKEGRTPLFAAAENGCTKAVMDLLDLKKEDRQKRVSISARDKDGKNMVMVAAAKGKREVLDAAYMAWLPKDQRTSGNPKFLKKVMTIDKAGNSGMALAAQNNHPGTLEYLLERVGKSECDPDQKILCKDKLNHAGENLYFIAAKLGHVDMLNILDKYEVDPRQINEAGETALMAAVAGGHEEMANRFLKMQKGDGSVFNPLSKNEVNNWTLLHYAVQSPKALEMVEWSLGTAFKAKEQLSAVLSSITKDGQTPLRLALAIGNYFVIKTLLDHGASVQDHIDPDDVEGRRLAAWYGVKYSLMDVVQYFHKRADSWEDIWQQPANCTGDLEASCTDSCDGLLKLAENVLVAHHLLDWQERVERMHPDKPSIGPEVDPNSSQVLLGALEYAFSEKQSDVALALLSRGVWDIVKEKFVESFASGNFALSNLPLPRQDPTLPAPLVTMEDAQNWNRLHFGAFSCDANALTLALNFTTEELFILLDNRSSEGTPYEIATQNPDCIRSWSIINILQQAWDRLWAYRWVFGGVAVFLGICKLDVWVLFLLLQSLLKMFGWNPDNCKPDENEPGKRCKMYCRKVGGFMYASVIPMVLLLLGSLLVWVEGEATKGRVVASRMRKLVGQITLALGGVLLLTLSAIFISPGCEHRLQRTKNWGSSKRERFWQWLHFVLGLCLAIVLVLQAALIAAMSIMPDLVGPGAGILICLATVFPLRKSSPRVMVFSLHLAAGPWLLVCCVVKGSIVEGYFSFEAPTPEALLVVVTSLLSAWAGLPGTLEKIAKKPWWEGTVAKMRDNVRCMGEIEMTRKEATGEAGKFVALKLKFGDSASSAQGIEHALGLTLEQKGRLDNPELALEDMRNEALATGDPIDIENFDYIVDGVSGSQLDMTIEAVTSLKTGKYHGGSIGPRDFDTGHNGRRLDDWMQTQEAQKANLSKAEFVAVRFYTSSSFPKINNPLRNKAVPHPWATVVALVDRGIKKLRSVQAQVDPEGFARETTLWRGMSKVEVDVKTFAKQGGTELAPMSTTTDEEVARKYAGSEVPVVFKYKVSGMRTGVCIQFLSLYPKEKEFLYPPLTYLTLKDHYEDDGTTVYVVEPVMS